MDVGYVFLIATVVSVSLFFSGVACMVLHQKYAWGDFSTAMAIVSRIYG